jgi:DNA (cytosine-5)-methyltransferase 1
VNELALFAGAGGGILGGQLLGWRTVCAVEYDPYAAGVLLARQNDGLLPPFPIWDDVRTFDGRPWRGRVDVVSGGFPCQDISAAGKGAGIDGERSGLWVQMARIIGEVRPRFAFVENSPMLASRGLGVVLGDLAAMGFDARWGVLGAADVGAPHLRERIWIVAESNRIRSQGSYQHCSLQRLEVQEYKSAGSCANGGGWEREVSEPARNMDSFRRSGQSDDDLCGLLGTARLDWTVEPDVGRVAHGVAARVDRLKCLGNGQVPLCAAAAWRILSADADPHP